MVVSGANSENKKQVKNSRRQNKVEKDKKKAVAEVVTDAADNSFQMAAVPPRSRTFDSLSLPTFNWGRQKQLTFGKIDYDGGGRGHISSVHHRSPSSSSRRESALNRSDTERRRPSPSEPDEFLYSPPPSSEIGQQTRRKSFVGGEDGEGIEAVRTKLILDFQTEVDRMKVALLKQGNEEDTEPPPSRTEPETKTWNLRTRRPPSLKDADVTAGKNLRIDDRRPTPASTLRDETKVPRLRSETAAAAAHAGDQRPGISRPKFSIPLSKSEIERDIIAMTGSKPLRRPKRRPRSVQKRLDRVFPGTWLSEITPEMYGVNEKNEAAKRCD